MDRPQQIKHEDCEETIATAPDTGDHSTASMPPQPELDPLLADQRREHHSADLEPAYASGSVLDEDEELESTAVRPASARAGDQATTYTLFLLLGGGALLGWNSFIVSLPFFTRSSAIRASPWSKSFPSTLSFVLTASNLVALVLAIRTQKQVSPERRNTRALVGLIALLLPLALYATQSPDCLSPTATYLFVLVTGAGVSAAGSFLQNASKQAWWPKLSRSMLMGFGFGFPPEAIALASVFGPLMMTASLSGQGFIGVAVSVAQYLSVLHGSKLAGGFQEEEGGDRPKDGARSAALVFFTLATLYAVFTLGFQLFVSRYLPSYRSLARLAEKLNHDRTTTTTNARGGPPASFRRVERKVRTLGVSVGLIFVVTIAVFPAVTSTVVSVRPEENDTSSFFAPDPFVAFGFVVFNVADWCGRSLPSWPALRLTPSPQALVLCSCLRVVFIVSELFMPQAFCAKERKCVCVSRSG